MKKITQAIGILLCIAFFNTTNAQVVTSAADDGSDGTLRQEIIDTPSGGTITFGVTVLNVTLNSELVINKSLTIQGSTTLNTIIDADNNGRVFNVTAASLTLNNLDLINGVEGDGGAIYVTNATVNINDCEITGNIANGASGSGDDIFVDTGGKIIAADSEISNNQSNRAGGGIEDNSGAGVGVELLNVVMNNNNVGFCRQQLHQEMEVRFILQEQEA